MNDNKLKLILVRHGETEWNKEGRYQGQKDSPLTSKGKDQAAQSASKVLAYLEEHNEINNIVIYSSPLGRARATAEIIAGTLGIPNKNIIFDDSLKEFDYGIFEGELKSFCQTYYAEIFDAREANKWFYQIEQGESYEMLARRLSLWIQSLKRWRGKTIIVVAHEMLNRTLRGLYLGLEYDETLKLKQPNDRVLLLEKGKEKILF